MAAAALCSRREKQHKKVWENNKFKIFALIWLKNLNYLMFHTLVSDVNKDSEFVMKKLMTLLDSDNKSIKIYSNKLKTG